VQEQAAEETTYLDIAKETERQLLYILHVYINTYIHAYILTYVHTYIHKYIHTNIHTHIHTHARMKRSKFLSPNSQNTSQSYFCLAAAHAHVSQRLSAHKVQSCRCTHINNIR
jgi:hypothetical protein